MLKQLRQVELVIRVSRLCLSWLGSGRKEAVSELSIPIVVLFKTDNTIVRKAENLKHLFTSQIKLENNLSSGKSGLPA